VIKLHWSRVHTHLQEFVNSLSDICGIFNWQTEITFWSTRIWIQANNWLLIPSYSTSCHKVSAITSCWDYYVSPIYIALRVFRPVNKIILHNKHRRTFLMKNIFQEFIITENNHDSNNKFHDATYRFKKKKAYLF
jgi:hypothetical protein